MKRDKGIIAYGTGLDREKLAVLAGITKLSASEWIIMKIRQDYEAAFGETPPECIIPQQR